MFCLKWKITRFFVTRLYLRRTRSMPPSFPNRLCGRNKQNVALCHPLAPPSVPDTLFASVDERLQLSTTLESDFHLELFLTSINWSRIGVSSPSLSPTNLSQNYPPSCWCIGSSSPVFTILYVHDQNHRFTIFERVIFEAPDNSFMVLRDARQPSLHLY